MDSKAAVFVVYHNVIGDTGSIFIYAICRTQRKAKIARSKAAGFRSRGQFFTVDPDSSPYAVKLGILKVQVDRLYSLGVLSHVNRCNVDELEVIS
jgi:hypothetical protein